MRVALVHSFYASGAPSGENVVVTQEATALARAGHEVHVVRVETDQAIVERFYRVRAGVRVATGRGRSPLGELRMLAPDVVHVHNLFPNFGTRWVGSSPAPVVTTSHNYRALCASGTFFRDGEGCRLCTEGHRWAGVRHGCYRTSKIQTLPLAVANLRGLERDPVFGSSRRVVVMSDEARRIYIANGLSADRIVVKPHFVSEDLAPTAAFAATAAHTGPWLYVGNLLSGKGIVELVRRWPRGHPLVVVGDGPLRSVVEEAAGDDVKLLGVLPRKRVLELMAAARGLVFPSRFLETFGMVYAEGLACGLPVLAFEGNVVASQVRRDGTGRVVRWDEDLEAVLLEAEAEFPSLVTWCRQHFDRNFTERAHIDRIQSIYAEAMG